MRASLIQLARLRNLQASTIALLMQAIEATGGLDLDTEHEIDLEWVERYRALAPAYGVAVRGQHEADLAEQRALGAHNADLDLVNDIAKAHVCSFWALLSNVLRAMAAEHERAIALEAATKATREALMAALGKSGDLH